LFEFHFSEPVNGITRTTTRVTSIETPDEQPVILHGTWTCRSPHEHPVRCKTGSVRYPEFTYSSSRTGY